MLPGAAELLARGLSETEREQITAGLEKHIEKHWGKPIDFRALVYDEEGQAQIPEWAQPFARVGKALVRAPQEPEPPDDGRPTVFMSWASPELRAPALHLARWLAEHGIRVLESGRHRLPRQGVFFVYSGAGGIVLTDEMIRAIEFGLPWMEGSTIAYLEPVLEEWKDIAPPVVGAPQLQRGSTLTVTRYALSTLITHVPLVVLSHEYFDGRGAVLSAIWMPDLRRRFANGVQWIQPGDSGPNQPDQLLVFETPKTPVQVPPGCCAILLNPEPLPFITLGEHTVYEGPPEAQAQSLLELRERLSSTLANSPRLSPYAARVLVTAAPIVQMNLLSLWESTALGAAQIWFGLFEALPKALRDSAGQLAAIGHDPSNVLSLRSESLSLLARLGYAQQTEKEYRPTPLLDLVARRASEWPSWNEAVLHEIDPFAPALPAAFGRNNFIRLSMNAGTGVVEIAGTARWWRMRLDLDAPEAIRNDFRLLGLDLPDEANLESALREAAHRKGKSPDLHYAALAYLEATEALRATQNTGSDEPIPPPPKPTRFILIAGTRLTTNRNAPDRVRWAAQHIAYEIAMRGYGLACGIQRGADEAAIQAYISAFPSGTDLRGALRIVSFEPNADEVELPPKIQVQIVRDQAIASVLAADAVVLVGGYEQARLVYQQAVNARKPVFPIPGVGGASKSLYWREGDGQHRQDVPWALAIEVEADAKAVAHHLLNAIEEHWRSSSKPSILWVDDHPENNSSLAEVLQARGYTVHLARSTDEALERLRQTSYRIVITDAGRAGNHNAGFELARTVSAAQPSVRLIFYTGYRSDRRNAQFRQLGAELYTHPEALLKAILGDVTQPEPERWVRISGTGRFELPSGVAWGAELAGATVARARLGLITGGWQGVDHVAGRAFATSVEEAGLEVDKWLRQILAGVSEPDLPLGTVERHDRDISIAESVNRAYALILVGGEGGAWDTFRAALERRKLIIPIADSGGDAQRAWRLLRFAAGAERLRAPKLRLTGRNATLRQGLPALEHDLQQQINFETGAGALVVALVVEILPLCDRYLGVVPLPEHEGIADKVRDRMRGWENVPAELISALVREEEWRLAGYFCFQQHPQVECVQSLHRQLPTERRVMEERGETRPLWQWLNCIRLCIVRPKLRKRLLQSLREDLEGTLHWLESHQEVDSGGQCKKLLSEMVGALRPSSPE